ncbi:MAG: T9SS type A sorting domain-containing protein [Ignavibacteria bacterium]|nr:T9SS type A sorting domain-containing protein [Ignavibacteria bacterium]
MKNYFKGSVGILILAVTLLYVQTSHAQSNWFWQQPLPAGNSLKDVKFVNHQTGYAVGDVGTIVKSTNGGSNWFTLNNPKKSQLWGIDFAPGNASVLIAVGDSGLILRTSNAGESWNVIQFQAGVIYEDVDFVNSTTGYVVGSGGRIFKTTNAGANWFQQTSPTGANFLCVNFFDENFGAIGGTTRLLLTTNAGTTWVVQNLTFFPFTQVSGISAIDSATVIGVVNNNGGTMLKTTNRGQDWIEEPMGIPYQDLVRDLSFSGKNNGTIVCDLGMIVRTTNAGASWILDSTFYQYFQRSYGIDLLRGVHMVDTSLTYISGGGGSIYRSTNAGQNWTILSGGYFDLHGSHFVNANTGWCVGEEGTVQKTTNGGTNWSFYPQITREVLWDVMFPSQSTGYISGDSGVILKTTNTGTNWFFLNSGTRINLFDIFFINNETGFCGGGFTSDPDPGVGIIMKTVNGGNNWETVFYYTDSGWVNALHFFDENTGIACFDRGIRRTTNGGLNWLIVGTGSTGRGLDMSFPNSQTGYTSGGSNTFYKTTNSGLSWLGYSTGNPGVVIQTIHFINSLKGFAAGPYGEILYTENGGLNWTINRGLSENYIASIYFSDSINGTMTGIFGTILKTTNGGISYIDNEAKQVPEDFQLHQNYPNPFNPTTTIRFSLKRSAEIKIVLSNILGKQVRVLTDKFTAAGDHKLLLKSAGLSTGVYFCSLIANGSVAQTIKLLLIK